MTVSNRNNKRRALGTERQVPTTKVKVHPGYFVVGCLGIAALFLLGLALFTVVWNIVIADIFGGPRLSMVEGFFVWLFITIIGGAFRSTRS